MATYPGGIPSLTNPSSTDPLSSPAHATQHSNANDEIEAICTELGTTPKAGYADVGARLDAMTALIGAQHTQNTDDGTDGTFYIGGLTGPLLKDNSGDLQLRDAGDANYADLLLQDINVQGNVTNGVQSVTVVQLNQAVLDDHTHANKALLDTYTQTEANLASAVSLKHTQNTDTGSDNETFQLNNGNPLSAKIKVDDLTPTIFDVRNAADDAFADVRADNFRGDLQANNADLNRPEIRYNESANYWELSNDGVSFGPINAAIFTSIADTATVDLDITLTVLTANVIPGGVDHDSLLNYDANDHIDHTTVSISAGTGLSGGGTIAATRTLNVSADYSVISGNDANTDVTGTELETLTDGSNADLLHTHASITDDKVKVDAAATADYIGAANTDGVLRTGTGLSYTDGGNYVTLAVNATYATITANDGATDVTAAELEELTDGSTTALHTHTGIGGAVVYDVNQASHGFAVGDVLRMSGTTYVKAQADSVANAEAVGIVSAVAGVDDFTIQTAGRITGLSGLTAGTVYFLDDDTAGLLTSTEPPDVGDVSKPLLIADTTTTGFVFNMRGSEIAASKSIYTETFVDGDLASGILTVTHDLGTQYTTVVVYDNNNRIVQPDDITATSTTVTTIDLSSFGTLTGTWHATVIGVTTSVTAVDTLDAAYDGPSGSGSGRSITADSGSVAITVPDGTNDLALEITNNDSTNNPHTFKVTNAGGGTSAWLDHNGTSGSALYVDNAGTGHGISIIMSGVIGNNLSGLNVLATGVNTTATSYVARFHQDNASSTQRVCDISQDGSGHGLVINHVVTPLAGGQHGLYVYTEQANVNADSALVKITQDSASATEPALEITNAGTGNGIEVNQTGNTYGIKIHCSQSTQTAAALLVDQDGAQNATTAVVIQNSGKSSALVVDHYGDLATNQAALDLALNSGWDTTNAAMGLRIRHTTVNTNAGTSLFKIDNDNNGATCQCAYILQKGTGHGLYIDKPVSTGALAASKRLLVVGNAVNRTAGSNWIADFVESATGSTESMIRIYNSSAIPSIELAAGGSGDACIRFPATQANSTGVNDLDDYEEGTYTATLTSEGGGTITLDSLYDTLSYTKIGNLCFVSGSITTSAISSPTGALRLNLPFAAGDYTERSDTACFWPLIQSWGSTPTGVPFCYIRYDGGTDVEFFDANVNAGTVTDDLAPHIGASTTIVLSFTYRTAT